MSGLILLVALAVLIALLVWLSSLITRRLPLSSNWKTWLRVAIVVGAFPLMLVDEIIGKYQFEALCKANGIESADVSNARGKKVKREISERKQLTGYILPINFNNEVVKDAFSGDVLFIYTDYFTNGGWIMRRTPINMGHARAILFKGNGCGFQREREIFHENKIEEIN